MDSNFRFRREGTGFRALVCCVNSLPFRPATARLVADRARKDPNFYLRIEHFQGHLVVMGEIGEALEDAEQFLVPGSAQDLHITGAALRAERAEPGDLVAALRGWRNGKAAEGAQGRGTALSNVAEKGPHLTPPATRLCATQHKKWFHIDHELLGQPGYPPSPRRCWCSPYLLKAGGPLQAPCEHVPNRP